MNLNNSLIFKNDVEQYLNHGFVSSQEAAESSYYN